MGNINSTHIALFPNLSSDLEWLSPAEITAGLLSSYFGKTYAGSPFIFSHGPDGRYEISFCEKWKPSGIFELFKQYPQHFERAFVRFVTDMGDYDEIFSLANDGENFSQTKARTCLYLFDELIFREFEGMQKLNPVPVPSLPGYFRAEINGLLESRNEVPLVLPNGLNSLLYETPERASTHFPGEIFTENETDLNWVLAHSADVRLMYQNCTIERHITANLVTGIMDDIMRAHQYWSERDGRKIIYFSSGWRNCGDEEFLGYVKERKQAYATYLNEIKNQY